MLHSALWQCVCFVGSSRLWLSSICFKATMFKTRNKLMACRETA